MTATGTLIFPDLVSRYLRTAQTYGTDDLGNPVATFEPPLSAAEQTTFNDLVLMAKLGLTNDLTLAEFQAIKPALLDARTFRQQSDAAFSALTAAQRDAALRAALFNVIDVLRALLRS